MLRCDVLFVIGRGNDRGVVGCVVGRGRGEGEVGCLLAALGRAVYCGCGVHFAAVMVGGVLAGCCWVALALEGG